MPTQLDRIDFKVQKIKSNINVITKTINCLYGQNRKDVSICVHKKRVLNTGIAVIKNVLRNVNIMILIIRLEDGKKKVANRSILSSYFKKIIWHKRIYKYFK